MVVVMMAEVVLEATAVDSTAEVGPGDAVVGSMAEVSAGGAVEEPTEEAGAGDAEAVRVVMEEMEGQAAQAMRAVEA